MAVDAKSNFPERFFSLSGYVVSDLRRRLDENRAEMMCLMKVNWSEYKNLLNEC
ncbi:hypothetical protein PPTG_21544 [Phytophthora nicotianae INRA-310]|uniref:HAT C-terminal dimerisation domain-containing protein n=1 Tax=Phytophthora nicotianae (strain INRA-310) TaxID=761204 RepID=W2R0W2_PHYN3|nr:hypothetical protein PPTG_21544 [Phytophthora nicotianae INRA-310]ETN18334.1 hypothetical protein PPTG_21544 [Phytophthora nicotianae INRA-310]